MLSSLTYAQETVLSTVYSAVSLLSVALKWFVAAFLLVNREQLYTTDDANQGSQWDNANPQTGEFFSLLKDSI